jgi:phosphoribosylformylglycinamidine synthase subunit PurQ / glutaminase
MEKLQSLILDGFGINCAAEMCAAYKAVGVEARIVHLSEIFAEKVDIMDFDILNFPGGFSYGDDLGAGRVLANLLKYKKLKSGKTFFSSLLQYIDAGNYILGICNGFQVLLALGLLPGLEKDYQQEAVLTVNDSTKFEDRWVSCVVPKNSLAQSLLPSGISEFPVRHKEGKLVIKNREIEEQIEKRGLIALQYCLSSGEPTSMYPYNPNNSWMSSAGLIHPNGRILGLMPHPEAALSLYNHPNWDTLVNTSSDVTDKGDGYRFFKKIVNNIIKNKKIETL